MGFPTAEATWQVRKGLAQHTAAELVPRPTLFQVFCCKSRALPSLPNSTPCTIGSLVAIWGDGGICLFRIRIPMQGWGWGRTAAGFSHPSRKGLNLGPASGPTGVDGRRGTSWVRPRASRRVGAG